MKNTWELRGAVTAMKIARRNGQFFETLIDTADLPAVVAYGRSWCAKWSEPGKRFYVATTLSNPYRTFYLHRFLMGDPPGLVIDHIDHDAMNNRRSNLRAVTDAVNKANRRLGLLYASRGGTGVTFTRRRRWQAQATVNGRTRYLGVYSTKEEALAAVDRERQNLSLVTL